MTKLGEIIAKIDGWYLPVELQGRRIIKGKNCQVGSTIKNDAPIYLRRTVKIGDDKAPVLNKHREPVFDWLVFIPIDEGSLGKAVIVSKSPPIVQIARSLCTVEVPSERENETLFKAPDCLEGDVKIGTEMYDYGEKGQHPVITLIEP